MSKMLTAYECPVCKSTSTSRGTCYCEYYKDDTKGKANYREYIYRKTRRVKGFFTIKSFSNLGYGISAKINLEKDGEKFELYLAPLANQIIGKSEIYLTLFEKQSGIWTTSGYSDDYIICPKTGVLRLKEEIQAKFYVTNILHHKNLKNTRYARFVLESPSLQDRKFEVFAKDVGDLPDFFSGKLLKLREDKTAGSYVWKVISLETDL